MKKSLGWTLVGILSILAGAFALLNPLKTSLSIEQLAGWLFLLVGVVQFIAVFKEPNWGGKLWALLWALVGIWCGISLLWHPLQGLVTLTWILGLNLLISGIFKAVLAVKVRPFEYWWVILLSAAISVLLGLLIVNNVYIAALGGLGIILGLELLHSGISLILIGRVDESKVK